MMDYIVINDEELNRKKRIFGEVVFYIISFFFILAVISFALSFQTQKPLREYIDYNTPDGYAAKDLLSAELTQSEREQMGDIANVVFCRDDRGCFGVMILTTNELNREAVADLKENVMETNRTADGMTVMTYRKDNHYLWETEDVFIIGYYCAGTDRYKKDYERFIKSIRVKGND